MLYLLQLEWLKVRKMRAFNGMVFCYLLFLPLLFLINFELPDEMAEGTIFSRTQLLQFPLIWKILGYYGSWVSFFFLGMLPILTLTAEFKNRTLRQNIITGISRDEFFLSKFYLLIVIATGATLYYFAWCLFVGLTFTDVTSIGIITQGSSIIGRYLLMILTYMTMGLFLGVWIRKTGLALISYFGYFIFLETGFRWIVHFNLFQNKNMHYYPGKLIADLIPFPFSQELDNFNDSADLKLFLTPAEAAIGTFVYIILFLVLARYLLKTKDL